MNADEARDRAVNALANRFRAFGAAEPVIRAHEFIGGLQADGWIWMPVENRPRPPRRSQECPTHAGQYAERCAGCAADELENTTPPRQAPPKKPKPRLPRVRELLPTPDTEETA